MQVTGKCHCEAISFKAEVDPGRAVLCHCTDCRVMSGGPYRPSFKPEKPILNCLVVNQRCITSMVRVVIVEN